MMTKKTVIETVYEYDLAGKVVKKTMTETVEYDQPNYGSTPIVYPYVEPYTAPYWAVNPTCSCDSTHIKE